MDFISQQSSGHSLKGRIHDSVAKRREDCEYNNLSIHLRGHMNKILPLQPRQINPAETFQRLVSWIKNRAVKDKMPGIIVGVSGTDSLVVFLAVYYAFKELGRPDGAMAVNFVHPGSLQKTGDGKITCAAGNDKDWFAQNIMPWLKEIAPDACYVLDDSIAFNDDNKRWGNIFSRAISDTQLNHGMLGNYRLVAGTRNRSESALGTYTLLSRAPSLQPIEHLYKTQILDICAYLNVPHMAIEKSREVDCDCGRFDVQAHHLDALDYYIMSQQGDLDPAFLQSLDPDVLLAVRDFYLEERENNAFREKIPYRPTPTKTVYRGADIETALHRAANNDGDTKSISIVTPRIVIDKDARVAHDIVTSAPQQQREWMAESFVLIGVEGLAADQIRAMAVSLFGAGAAHLDADQLQNLAQLSGRIGQYGFSFPAKRFTTRRFAGGSSLVERAGFTRQKRPTDVRDATLPASDPQRDHFGIGFTWIDAQWYIEQRRAYVAFSSLSADMPVTLIVRNSSHFFGRDRLRHAAYVSWGQKDSDTLLQLDVADIENEKNFTPWQHILDEDVAAPLHKKLERTAYALSVLDGVDLKFAQWLRTHNGNVKFKTPHPALDTMFNGGGGYTYLRAFLKEALINHVSAELPDSPLYLAQLDLEHTAPWQPHSICKITADTLAQLKNAEKGIAIKDDKLRKLFHLLKQRQLILMSGQYGDFPLR